MLVSRAIPMVLLAIAKPPLRPPPTSCASSPSSDAVGLRQRLKEVQVDSALLAEVTTIVTHKPASLRHPNANGRRAESTKAAALPLYNPFGTKPRFIASADRASSFPPETLPEVAFIGRSNVGKSSLLNALTGVSALAKVSDKPGKTQKLNFFELGRKDRAFMLVDMPGCADLPLSTSRPHVLLPPRPQCHQHAYLLTYCAVWHPGMRRRLRICERQ